jgi:hypothetical protein
LTDYGQEEDTLAFVKDFGNSAPLQQCVYFGSFTDFVGTNVVTLARNIDKKWACSGRHFI